MMYAVYYLHTDELNNQFLESLKTLFKDKTIEIIVTEVDETAYLLQSEENKKRLLKAIEHVENGEHLIGHDLNTLT